MERFVRGQEAFGGAIIVFVFINVCFLLFGREAYLHLLHPTAIKDWVLWSTFVIFFLSGWVYVIPMFWKDTTKEYKRAEEVKRDMKHLAEVFLTRAILENRFEELALEVDKASSIVPKMEGISNIGPMDIEDRLNTLASHIRLNRDNFEKAVSLAGKVGLSPQKFMSDYVRDRRRKEERNSA